VPHEVFADSSILHTILDSVITYNGFATDTTKAVPESDNASALRGKPSITLQYSHDSLLILHKRVETTQKATALITASEVSADNYNILSRPIVIMATVEEEDDAVKIFCRLGNNCGELSEAVCLAIGGELSESCDIKVSCVINGTCVANVSAESCRNFNGEIVESCEATILRPNLSSGSFKIWQTASGIVNVDLGYMPLAPVVLQVYNLKGKLITSEYMNVRFATVKVNVSKGVYLFRVGNRSAVKVFN
jgi:hypothetical protein